MKNKRIFISGISGSGKTTLGKQLSKILMIKPLELDDLKYKEKFSEKRSIKERNQKINQIVKKELWVVEGGYIDKWV